MVLWIWFLGIVLVFGSILPSAFSDRAQNALFRLTEGKKIELSEIESFPLVERDFRFRPRAALVVDLRSDYIVQGKNIDAVRPIASLTKIMSSLVLVQNRKLDEVVTIPAEATEVEGSKAGFKAGEKFRVRDLVKAMLIRSANDAAFALEKHYSSENFDLVKTMNERAKQLGLSHTVFADAIGLSAKNRSTAWELYLLTKEFLKHSWLAKVVSQSQVEVCSLEGRCYSLWNTNRLVRQGFKGVKTGYTEEAGHCLIALKYIQNHPVIFIVLGAPDGHIRFEDVELAGEWLEREARY